MSNPIKSVGKEVKRTASSVNKERKRTVDKVVGTVESVGKEAQRGLESYQDFTGGVVDLVGAGAEKVGKEAQRRVSSINEERKRTTDRIESAFAFDLAPDAPTINIESPELPARDASLAARMGESERRRRGRARGRASTVLGSGVKRQTLG